MRRYCRPALTVLILWLAAGGASQAAGPGTPPAPAESQRVNIPDLFDPHHRPPRPAVLPRRIRFLTDEDYPPFHFIGPDGTLTGFNIEIARGICEELQASCTIQSRRWDTLVDALDNGEGDAIVASLSMTAESRQHMAFTLPYYRTPARFVVRRDKPLPGVREQDLKGVSVAVVRGSAHAAFLEKFFPDAVARAYPDNDSARQALRNGDAEALFGDGVGLAVWLNSEQGDCCAFSGGPFLESRYFGDGVGIAVRRKDESLRKALDYGLVRLWDRGRYTNLYLKYFPVGFF